MKKGVKVAIVIGAILIVGGVGGSIVLKNGSNSASTADTGMYFENVMAYQKQDLSESISVSGTVESESSMNITSSFGSKVESLNVSIGDYVKKGDVICTLEDTNIKKQISELETSIKNGNAIDDNTKKQNEQALQEAKEDQVIQLKDAQSQIDDAQNEYDKAYKKYTDRINDINNCVAQYNDVCQQIANYESSMPDDSYDDSSYDDGSYDDYDDSYGDSMNLMSYNVKDISGEYNYTNLSYGGDDTYSQLIQQREELSAKIESYKQECSGYEDQFDSLKKAITTAKDNYASVKRSTDKAIASAQNTIDMQDYQSTDSTNSTQLEELKKQLSECTVKAEKDGTITALGISQGDTVEAGTLLATIENDNSLKINVNIDEGDILKVKEGMKVVVTSEATGETEINGVVSKVVTIISSGGNNNNNGDASNGGGSSSSGFTAEITITDDCDLLVGMNAKAKIMLSENTDSYAILYDCIMYDEDGTPYVYVADTSNGSNGEDGSTTATVKRVDVTTGEDSGSYVQITGGDLSDGDLVITTPYEVSEGDTITLSPYMDFAVGDGESVVADGDDGLSIVTNEGLVVATEVQ